jgi:hypothetical protein
MARRLLFLILATGCALGLAACGATTKEKPQVVGQVYTRAPVVRCLKAHGFTVSTREKDMNFIAYTATGGGLRAWKPKKHRKVDLILAFGVSGEDAKQTMRGVKRFALRSPIFRFRLRDANVVILWAYRPSKSNRTLLSNCLKKSISKSQSS